MESKLITYHNSAQLSLLITLPDGNKIEQLIFGAAALHLLKYYDLVIIEKHETYDVMMPTLKAAEAEKEVNA